MHGASPWYMPHFLQYYYSCVIILPLRVHFVYFGAEDPVFSPGFFFFRAPTQPGSQRYRQYGQFVVCCSLFITPFCCSDS